ncbi:MAG: hypothetical protein IJ087_01365 [Eggerthellaceae bacterium]|nr:hypothetical protein [Eggerthellaceae bacterium]
MADYDGYWKDFEDMALEYEFEVVNDRGEHVEGEVFGTLQAALDAFGAWKLLPGERGTGKRVNALVKVPTDRGEMDTFAVVKMLEE